jgi:hypothetical protein
VRKSETVRKKVKELAKCLLKSVEKSERGKLGGSWKQKFEVSVAIRDAGAVLPS